MEDMKESVVLYGRMRSKIEACLLYTSNQRSEDVLDLIDQIERGFEDIEHRIANMDKEHSKYVRATVTRLNYLLSEESDRKGLLISLLNQLRESDDTDGNEKKIEEIARHMNLSAYEVLSENPLFKRLSLIHI